MCCVAEVNNWAIFFEDRRGNIVTINRECYHGMLVSFFFLELRKKTWFQQDEATPHTTNVILECLKKIGERVISHRGQILWLPWSLDLSPPDFFFYIGM